MSSSSALISAIVLGLADFNGLPDTRTWQDNITDDADLAGYLACHENGMTFKNLVGAAGVGTFGGSEDHTAMVCSKDGQLGQFRFCPIRLQQRVPFPEDMSFVVIVSGVAAEKTGAARDLYNAASLATREIIERWNSTTGREDAVLGDALVTDPNAEKLHEVVSDRADLTRRLDHFLTESESIIPEASKALACGDLERFGRMADESQRAAEDLLGNQVPQTSALARIARELGATGATSFGAGFGGWCGLSCLMPRLRSSLVCGSVSTATSTRRRLERPLPWSHVRGPPPGAWTDSFGSPLIVFLLSRRSDERSCHGAGFYEP